MEQGTNLTAKKGTFDTLLWFLFPEMYNNPGNRSVEIFFDRSIDPNARVENVSFQIGTQPLGARFWPNQVKLAGHDPGRSSRKLEEEEKTMHANNKMYCYAGV
jgi:hypothetical protein